MLISIIERFRDDAESETHRYEGWTAAIRRLRSAMKLDAGGSIQQLADLVNPVPDDQKVSAMADLIAMHLEMSWAGGQGKTLDQYTAVLGGTYSELLAVETIPADLVEDEFLARFLSPERTFPKMCEYEARFRYRPDVLELLRRRLPGKGRYVRLNRIGHGAMGVVWEGYDSEAGSTVAIKIPLPAVVQDTDRLKRFFAEAEITKGWSHPGIAEVTEIDSGSENERPFYVMRLASPLNLSDRIRKSHQARGREHRRQTQQLLAALLRVASAIEYAHSRGVVHGDLTPANVACDETDEIAVLDWGMARQIDSSTDEAAAPSGTPEYMAPEQAGGITCPQTDVFGLGTILYEILTGRSPYQWEGYGSRSANWIDEVRQAAFQRPRKVTRRAPRKLESICLKAMAKDPEARFQTVSDFSGALRKVTGATE